jgi:hypothetical protein
LELDKIVRSDSATELSDHLRLAAARLGRTEAAQ